MLGTELVFFLIALIHQAGSPAPRYLHFRQKEEQEGNLFLCFKDLTQSLTQSLLPFIARPWLLSQELSGGLALSLLNRF